MDTQSVALSFVCGLAAGVLIYDIALDYTLHERVKCEDKAISSVIDTNKRTIMCVYENKPAYGSAQYPVTKKVKGLLK